jgi:dihydroorotate dehydrogenase electron transfer subunit
MGKKRRTEKATIIDNKKIAPDHYVINLESKFLSKNSLPGQFVNVKISDKGTDPLLRIPLGISRVTKKGIGLVYKVVGEGTQALSLKKKNEALDILGPLGTPFCLPESGKKREAILVAGGHGIAPLYALAEILTKRKKNRVTVFIGAAKGGHIVLAKEIKALGCDVDISTEDGSRGKKGYVTCLLATQLEKLGAGPRGAIDIYACGPRPMVAAVAREAEKHGLVAQVSLDAYMACGIGACMGCAVKTKAGYKMVCKDGPVFRSDEIEWEQAVVC